MSKLLFILYKMAAVMILYLSFTAPLNGQSVKNIIFMVPDGMGLSNVTAARIYAFGTSSQRLYFETLERIGYQSTYSANSMVTDSAAAASAWACGEKFNNGEISFHRETRQCPETILELARNKGKKTGLVATSTVTHATPAAFAAHVQDRRDEPEIARQYIYQTKVDVILGGGKKFFEKLGIAKTAEFGYTIVETSEEMSQSIEKNRLLGFFQQSSLTPEYKKDLSIRANSEPSLAEMTRTALKILERSEQGFFLLIEGSQIDWANHQNNLPYMIGEILAFDKAVKVVLDWLEQDGFRRQETLMIIAPDHDCGGLGITGPREKRILNPGGYAKSNWIWSNHTGEDTVIWSQGPYSEHLGKAIDNTDVYYIMKAALNGEYYHQNGFRSR